MRYSDSFVTVSTWRYRRREPDRDSWAVGSSCVVSYGPISSWQCSNVSGFRLETFPVRLLHTANPEAKRKRISFDSTVKHKKYVTAEKKKEQRECDKPFS